MPLGKRKRGVVANYANYIRRKVAARRAGRYVRNKPKMTKWRSSKMIKRMINSRVETKRVDQTLGRVAVYHNGGTSGVNGAILHQLNTSIMMPAQGDGDSGRDGNDIYAIGFTVRMQFNVPADRLNTKFRCFIFRVVKGYALSTSYAQLFDAVTSNCMIDPIDKDRVTVMKQFWVSPGKSLNPGVPTTGKEITYYRKVFVPLKKVIKFYDDGSQDNNNIYDYHLAIFGYDTFGSLASDIVGYCQVWNRFTFKDK